MALAGLVFVVTLLLGLPIAFVLGLTGVIHLATMDASYFAVIAQRMFSGINVTSLTCIPFFVAAGELMNGGGVTEKLLAFIRELVGSVRGGLAYAAVITGAVLSAILGSANAVTSILCSTMVPDMEKDGYDGAWASGLLAATGVLGPIIPPSTTFVFYSMLSGASIKGLFMAGFIPGILLAAGYCLVIFLYVRKSGLPKAIDHVDFKRLFRAFVSAIPALLVPIVIVGGIMGGFFTPTESGAVACVIAVIGSIIYKCFDIKKVPGQLLRAGMTTAGIMIIIAFGNIMGWSMAVDQIPEAISAFILSITTNKYLIIALMLFMLVIIGCLMEATAAMLIFTPMMLGIATSIGMDPLHFGLIFCIMLTIALVTPPVGMTLFTAANVTGIELKKISTAVIPFVVAALAVTVILAYLPDVVLFLPRVFLGY